jgi:hypothetical protein
MKKNTIDNKSDIVTQLIITKAMEWAKTYLRILKPWKERNPERFAHDKVSALGILADGISEDLNKDYKLTGLSFHQNRGYEKTLKPWLDSFIRDNNLLRDLDPNEYNSTNDIFMNQFEHPELFNFYPTNWGFNNQVFNKVSVWISIKLVEFALRDQDHKFFFAFVDSIYPYIKNKTPEEILMERRFEEIFLRNTIENPVDIESAKELADNLVRLLEVCEYTKEGKWNFEDHNKTVLISMINILVKANIIPEKPATTIRKIFAERFDFIVTETAGKEKNNIIYRHLCNTKIDTNRRQLKIDLGPILREAPR